MKTCPYCGVSMSNPRRVQCGAADCRRQYDRDRVKAFLTRRRDEDGVRYEDRYKAPRIEQRCQWCGSTFHRRIRVRSCGPKCQERLKSRARRGHARRRRAERKLAVAQAGTRGKGVLVAGSCSSCGAYFTARWRQGGDRPEYCSEVCKRRESKSRRRARTAGCKVTAGRRIAVYKRDGWTCQICHEPVDPDAVVPAPLAPTIDHKIPLAAGGEHAPHNWQCAHFQCNSAKRDVLEEAA